MIARRLHRTTPVGPRTAQRLVGLVFRDGPGLRVAGAPRRALHSVMRMLGRGAPTRHRRVSGESQNTLSLKVPWNSDLPVILSTTARIASLVGTWALIAVRTMGTSIR